MENIDLKPSALDDAIAASREKPLSDEELGALCKDRRRRSRISPHISIDKVGYKGKGKMVVFVGAKMDF